MNDRLQRSSLRRVALIVAAIVIATTMAFAAPAFAGTVTRGLDDNSLLAPDAGARTAFAHDAFDLLHAKVIHMELSWAKLEPASGVFDPAYLASIATAVAEARAHNVTVVISLSGTPQWAAQSSFFSSPPRGYANGYQPFYPPSRAAMGAFTDAAQTLAASLVGQVKAYECWNEPNLWMFFYPQTTSGDKAFAARRYLSMLKAFYAGIKAGDPHALVLAGATAPVGTNDVYRTSPRRFAGLLKSWGAGKYFNVYSHHPYTPGGTRHKAPEANPNNRLTTVTLGNIRDLLRIFPSKPFYLDEYGYNTAYTNMWGGLKVSQTLQADYLRRAYTYAARFRQVKMLLWHIVTDWSPTGKTTNHRGTYTGLRTITGGAKRSWYAFARGSRLTLTAPSRVEFPNLVRLSGQLTNAGVGPLTGKVLVVQRHHVGRPWRTLKKVTTGADGRYTAYLTAYGTWTYRVQWTGVITSPRRTVQVY